MEQVSAHDWEKTCRTLAGQKDIKEKIDEVGKKVLAILLPIAAGFLGWAGYMASTGH
jgi:hypothetical protein